MRNAVRQTRFRNNRKQSQPQIVTHPGRKDGETPVELSVPLRPVASATTLPQPAPELSHEEPTPGDPARSVPLSFGGQVARLAAAAEGAALGGAAVSDGPAA